MASISPRAARRASRRILARAVQNVSLNCEALESRRLLSVSTFGLPNWIEQGPGPITGGGVTGMPLQNNSVAGAVQAVAVNPNNANNLFIASVNGGIWRTNTATYSRANGINDDGDGFIDESDEEPTWTPLTDQISSTSMGAVAFSPLDATMQTLFAGQGRFSNGLGVGGPQLGMIRTTDGGTTWTPVGGSIFNGVAITDIIPTTNGTSLADQVVLAGTNNGLFRSINGGSSFTPISGAFGTGLPNGNIRDTIADPQNPGRFYAGVSNAGVYRSDDWGATWSPFNNGLTLANDGRDNDADTIIDEADEVVTLTDSLKLSIHNSGTNAVYVGLIDGGQCSGIFRSTDGGANWTQLGTVPAINPGSQGGGNFSIVADPVDPNVVFVGGDSGNAFQQRGDASTNTWTVMLDANAGGTRPHADTRNLYFDPNGDIIEVSDGGIFRLVDPNTPATRRWETVAGNLRTAELNSVSYDRTNNSIFEGAQDNGSAEQDGGGTFSWRTIQGADGSITAVDPDSAPGTNVYHFTTSQFLGTMRRREVSAANIEIGTVTVPKVINGTGGNNMTEVEESLSTKTQRGRGTLQFVQPYLLNAVDPTRMLVGTGDTGTFDGSSPTLNRGFLYESFNQGFNFTALGGVSQNLTTDGIDNNNDGVIDDAGEVLNTDGLDNDNDGLIDGADPTGEWAPINSIGAISAFAYGGRLNGVDNADVIYVASGATLRLRSQIVAGDLTDFSVLSAYTGGSIRAIQLDPDDWRVAYVADTDDVYVTTNAGVSFQKITSNLQSLSTSTALWNLDFARTALGDVLLAGGFGGVFRLILSAGDGLWSEYGLKMPEVIARDITYDPIDDVLVAGTYGRGAWKISNASATLAVPGVLQIDGDTNFPGQDDTIKLIRDPNNPLMLQVFLNNNTTVPTFTAPMSTIFQINVNGLGGQDTLIIDSTNGLISVDNSIRYDGGAGVDQLQLLQTGGTQQQTDTYSVGPADGQGSSVIVAPSNGPTQSVFFENLEPVLDLVPAAALVVHATNDENTINYGQGSIISRGRVTIDNFEPIEFANKAQLTINARAGTDLINLRNDFAPTGLLAITVSGGDPTALEDRLIVNGSSASDDIEVDLFIPPALGSADIDGAGPVPISALFLGALTIDGDGGNDDLTINTPNTSDAIDYIPGVAADAAAVLIGSQLPINFLRLGSSGSVTLDTAGASNDTLTYHGTPGNDAFAVSATGVISLNAQVPVATPGINIATLLGLAGDDTFTLAPALSASPFATLSFVGGENSIAGGDVANFIGTAGNDSFDIRGTTVMLGGKTLNCPGVETENLDAKAGTDTLHVASVTGVTEAFNVAASSTAGAGRVFVPGQMNVAFLSADFADVTGDSGDTDTLAFSATNNADRIEIKADAPGTTASPVLQLLDAASSATLLTLTNYLGIPSLRVNALDGQDLINIATGPALGRTLLIDGGQPTAKKKQTDKLNIIYASPRPKIVQSTTTQSPQSGLISLDYGTSKTLVQFLDIEDFVIRKA